MISVHSSSGIITSELVKLKKNIEKLEEHLRINPLTEISTEIFNNIQAANTSLKQIRKAVPLPPRSNDLQNSEDETIAKGVVVGKRKRESQTPRAMSAMSIHNLLNSDESEVVSIDKGSGSAPKRVRQEVEKGRISIQSLLNEEISEKEKEHVPLLNEPETFASSSTIISPTQWDLINTIEIIGKVDRIVFLEESKYAILVETSYKITEIQERFTESCLLGKTFKGAHKINDMSFNQTSMQLFYDDDSAIHIFPRDPGSISDQTAEFQQIDYDSDESLLSNVEQMRATDKHLAFGLHDGKVLLYDLFSLKRSIYFPNAHTAGVYALCMNDKYVVSGSSDKKVVYFDHTIPKPIARKISFDRTVSAMALEGSTLYAGNNSGVLKIINLENGAEKSVMMVGAVVGLIIDELGFYVATNAENKSTLNFFSHELQKIYSFPEFNEPISSIVKQGDCLMVCTVTGKSHGRNPSARAKSKLHKFKLGH